MFPLRHPAEDRALEALRREVVRIARRLERAARPLTLEHPPFAVCGAPQRSLRLLRGGRAR